VQSPGKLAPAKWRNEGASIQALQQRALGLIRERMEKEGKHAPTTGKKRVLCLDGGGIKGLVILEVLQLIERATGKKVFLAAICLCVFLHHLAVQTDMRII